MFTVNNVNQSRECTAGFGADETFEGPTSRGSFQLAAGSNRREEEFRSALGDYIARYKRSRAVPVRNSSHRRRTALVTLFSLPRQLATLVTPSGVWRRG